MHRKLLSAHLVACLLIGSVPVASAAPATDAATDADLRRSSAAPVVNPAPKDEASRTLQQLIDLQDRRPGLVFTQRPPAATSEPPSPRPAAPTPAAPSVPTTKAGLFGSAATSHSAQQQQQQRAMTAEVPLPVRERRPGGAPSVAMDNEADTLSADDLGPLLPLIRFVREHRYAVLAVLGLGLLLWWLAARAIGLASQDSFRPRESSRQRH